MSIHSNPEIENIVNTATTIAKDYNHQYVTLEHLLIALIEYPAFNKFLIEFGIEVEELLRDLYEYIGKQEYLVVEASKEELVPQRTHSLERVFNRAFTQVLFSAREQMETIDLYLSISLPTLARGFVMRLPARMRRHLSQSVERRRLIALRMRIASSMPILQ